MKYYILRHNGLNIKETGTQFQSVTGIAGDIQQDFIPFEGEINFPFKLPEPFLEKKAKLTTLINAMLVPDWFLIFKKHFIEFLSDFNIDNFQNWNLNIHQNNKIINDYHLFYIPKTCQHQLINFDKSLFEINSDWIIRNTTGEIIRFSNYESYLKELKKHNTPPYLLANNLVLDFSKQKNDIIRLINMPMTGFGYYISEKLKQAIENEGFTGFSFQEIEDMDKRIKVIF